MNPQAQFLKSVSISNFLKNSLRTQQIINNTEVIHAIFTFYHQVLEMLSILLKVVIYYSVYLKNIKQIGFYNFVL